MYPQPPLRLIFCLFNGAQSEKGLSDTRHQKFWKGFPLMRFSGNGMEALPVCHLANFDEQNCLTDAP